MEGFDDVEGATTDGDMDGIFAEFVGDVDDDSALGEDVDEFGFSGLGNDVGEDEVVFVVGIIEFGPASDEVVDEPCLAFAGGNLDEWFLIFVDGVGVGSMGEEEGDDGGTSLVGTFSDEAASVWEGDVGGGASFEEFADKPSFVGSGGVDEGVESFFVGGELIDFLREELPGYAGAVGPGGYHEGGASGFVDGFLSGFNTKNAEGEFFVVILHGAVEGEGGVCRGFDGASIGLLILLRAAAG